MQMLGADPNDIAQFDIFSKQWSQQVESNVKMEGNLREAALKNVKDRGEGGSISKAVEEKTGAVEKGKEKEEDLLDWEDAEAEEYEGAGESGVL